MRDGYLGRCGTPALALYLVLVTVADADGVSFYGDETLCRMLRWSAPQLTAVRRELEQSGLIAYNYPFYQVLSLDPEPPPQHAVVTDAPRSSQQGAERAAAPEEVRTLISEWKRRHGYA